MVPRIKRKRRRPRPPSLASHFRRGIPMRKIAEKFGLTSQAVRRIRDRGIVACYASGLNHAADGGQVRR
jgi:hypothetical protein